MLRACRRSAAVAARASRGARAAGGGGSGGVAVGVQPVGRVDGRQVRYASGAPEAAPRPLTDDEVLGVFKLNDLDADGVLQIDEVRELADAVGRQLPEGIQNVATDLLLRRAEKEGLGQDSALRFSEAVRKSWEETAAGRPPTPETILFRAGWASFVPEGGIGGTLSGDTALQCCDIVWQAAGQRRAPDQLRARIQSADAPLTLQQIQAWLSEDGLTLPSLAAAEAKLKRRSKLGGYVGISIAFAAYWVLSSSGMLSKVMDNSSVLPK
eukprot:Hpha_TRINITY_DN1570_c0_g1::TRINITY_DN1570_c0_g1_i1::g.57208::m.57208